MTQSPKLENSSTKLCQACNTRFDQSSTTCPQDNTPLIDLKADPMYGRRLAAGKYRVLRELGRGGMGAVYLAEDDEGKQVAVKLFKAQLTDRASAARFQEEAAAWSRLQHPHSATLLENMVDGKQPCLIVEFVHGRSLQALLKQEGVLSPQRCLHIFSQVMDTLKYAHDNGVLHRDLKPGNIVLTLRNGDEDFVKVVDFMVENLSFGSPSNLGLADLVSRGPIYMSPEQCQGKKLSEASDIYSLGVALYEGLVGKPPFKGRNSVETASMQISTPAPSFATINPDISIHPAVEQVVLRALEKDPLKRFANMGEFKQALTMAVTEPNSFVMPVSQHPSPATIESTTASSPERGASKKPPVLLIAGAAVLVIGGGIVAAMTMANKKQDTIEFSGSTLPANRAVEGTVLFVSLEPVTSGKQKTGYRLREVVLKTEKGETLKLTANLPRELDYKGPDVGDRCRAALEGSTIAKLKVLDADPSIKLARDVVLKFVSAVIASDWKEAKSLFGHNTAVTAETLKKDWSGTTAAVPEETPQDGDRFRDAPMPQVLKIVSASDQKMEILLNEASAFNKKNAIDKFILSSDGKGSWNIESLEQRIPRKDWHGS